MSAAEWVAVVASGLGALVGGPRWLRVAQREHYAPARVVVFSYRWWWRSGAVNAALRSLGLAGAVASYRWPLSGLAAAAVAGVAPRGLSIRGRSVPLRWTRRLTTLAGAAAVLAAASGAAVASAGGPACAAAALAVLVPLLVAAGCAVISPLERALARRFVAAARTKLGHVSPVVVAVTGSYGKTSTKLYIEHLLSTRYRVVASPASFNNRAGLARTVNEHMPAGTQMLVAEMGTYGPGEIREMCSWLAPEVAVICAIGPVHLERFGSIDAIVAAKSEVIERARSVVLNVEHPALAELARRLAHEGGKKVWQISGSDLGADVACVPDGRGGLVVYAGGARLGELGGGPAPTNVSCAVAVALDRGLRPDEVGGALRRLPEAPNRLSRLGSDGGFAVLDDTYNSNPAGARRALRMLAELGDDGHRRVLVTPGMVELGGLQAPENADLAREAAGVATDVVVVGRTNREALLSGLSGGLARVVVVGTRHEAVTWVRRNLGAGDVVLYENDLPDHFA